MASIDKPYFMESASWYKYDGDKYILTDKAPSEAIASYDEFYSLLTAYNSFEFFTQEELKEYT